MGGCASVQRDTAQGGSNTRSGSAGRVGTQPAAAAGAGGTDSFLASSGPVKPPSAWDYKEPITIERLDALRTEFWDSLIIGSASSRDTIRVAADCAMNGDYENCNAILASVDFRTNGTLGVVWDNRGVQYTLPAYAYSRPRNVISKEEASAIMRKVVAHKGEVVDVPVTLRLSSTLRTLEQDIPVTLRSDESAAAVKQRLHDMLCSGEWDKKDNTSNVWVGDMCAPSAQRLMYDGRELVDEQHMQQARVRPGSYLQVFLRMPLKGGA